jgi:3-oxoacyl-(acyl-carrier-protein) synthase
MLEKAEDAQARGALVVGEFLGSGCVTEATGVLKVRADGDGLSRAIQVALDEAGLSADAVGLIVAHGNGTPASDASEAYAFRQVFGSNMPPVTAFKWAAGAQRARATNRPRHSHAAIGGPGIPLVERATAGPTGTE